MHQRIMKEGRRIFIQTRKKKKKKDSLKNGRKRESNKLEEWKREGQKREKNKRWEKNEETRQGAGDNLGKGRK